MDFADQATVILKGGDGGRGVISWRREKGIDEGGPWGGDGGNGGSIYLIGDHNVDTLFDLRNKKQIDAPCGEPGATQMASGHSGEDLYIKVPIGTSVYDQKSNKLICDIVLDGQKYEICRGGRGGHGNAYFKNSKNRIPALYELGDKGEVRSITLKLRFLADVGIVGLPNAGKSTLITAISHAHPKIANYPFTTLNPVLGTVKYDEKTLTFADIPGLIEDASVGKGLGHDFLKHIERCHVLILLLSLSSNDTDDIIRDYQVLYQELKQYSKKLIKKPILIVGNKIDEDGADLNQEKLAKFLKQKVLVVSAKLQQNTDALIAEIFTNFYTKIMRKKRTLIAKARKLIRPENVVDRTFKIAKVDDHTWSVDSPFLDYWHDKIPHTTNDNIIRFTNKIKSLGVENAIIKNGGAIGDTMIICREEYTID